MIPTGKSAAAQPPEQSEPAEGWKKAVKPAPPAPDTSASAKQIRKTRKLGDLLAQKEGLREELAQTVAAEKQLVEEARQAQQQALEEELRLNRRQFVRSLGAAAAITIVPPLPPAAALQGWEALYVTPIDPKLFIAPFELIPAHYLTEIADVRAHARNIRRLLTTLSWEVLLILRYQEALGAIRHIFQIQIPWFLIHGCHPPAGLPAYAMGFFAPGSLRLTV
jgi:hypothetical protein